MISTRFTQEELKMLKNAEWYTSAFHLDYGCPDLEISTYSEDSIWYYKTGDHVFKWGQSNKTVEEMVEHLAKIIAHEVQA